MAAVLKRPKPEEEALNEQDDHLQEQSSGNQSDGNRARRGSAGPPPERDSGRCPRRDAVEHRLAKYVQIATRACPSLGQKTISMHVLHHSAAMRLLRAGIETSVIALWLGHEQGETTHIYLHADMGIKERALAATAPAVATPGRFRPNDKLLAFLEAL
jgi:integrase